MRTILHVDMNNFYASVECLYDPSLRGKPIAVAGDAEMRRGIVLAKSNEAKRCGVKTGDLQWEARRKCPQILFVPPHFERYEKYSKLSRAIYTDYTDQVEPFSLDECWLDVTGSDLLFGDGRSIADQIRARVRRELGLTVSVGVSFNKIFAKLGSDLKKPDATTVIPYEHFQEIVWPLPVGDLLFAGPSTVQALARCGVRTIGDLARQPREMLKGWLGSMGETLWRYANGLEDAPVARLDAVHTVKSIGNSTTTPRDLYKLEEVRVILYLLAESVAQRLRAKHFRCGTVQLSVRYADMTACSRQATLRRPANDSETLFAQAFSLFQALPSRGRPVNNLGIHTTKLIPDSQVQLSLLPEEQRDARRETLEKALDGIRDRFGRESVQRGILIGNDTLAQLRPRSRDQISK